MHTLLILFIMFVIFFLCTVYSFYNNDKSQIMSMSQTNTIKGFAIILTYFHHYGQICSEIYNAHSFLGFLGVALFFFCAGYVCYISCNNKKSRWENKYWLKKIERLYLPKIVVIWGFGIIAGRSLVTNFQETIMFYQDWFFTIIMVNYLFFYAAKKLSVNIVKCCLAGELVVFALCLLTNRQIMWYNTSFLFGLGVLFARDCKKILIFVESHYYQCLVGIVFVFLCSLYVSVMRYNRILSDSICGIAFVILFIILVNKYGFESRILNYIGKYSWEFYLVHARIIGIVQNRITNDLIGAFFISFGISLMVSIGVNLFLSVCMNKIQEIHS